MELLCWLWFGGLREGMKSECETNGVTEDNQQTVLIGKPGNGVMVDNRQTVVAGKAGVEELNACGLK